MKPTIPKCAECGSAGTYHDVNGSRCDEHRMFYPNEAQKLAGYVAVKGQISYKMSKDRHGELRDLR